MKELIKSALASGNFGLMQASALLIFFAVMVGVVIWTFRRGSQEYYRKVGQDILKEEVS